MLPKYLTLILTTLTPNFRSPSLEEKAVGVRIQFPTEQQNKLLPRQKNHIKRRIHIENATLIHFKQSKLSAEYIIDQPKNGVGLF